MSEILKDGDLVMLKSGGPVMTVESTPTVSRGGPNANCVWFDDSGKLTRAAFAFVALKKYAPQTE